MEPGSEAVDHGHPTYQPMNYSRSLGKSFIFLAALVLSIAAWFISFVSQAYVTNRVGNDVIGTLWFGIILQLGVILSIILCFLGESLFQYGITISIFAALATSYGAQGVHLNLFHNPTSAQKAVAAGWIITCIVNVIWIVILSCEPSSYVYRLVANNGRAVEWDMATAPPPLQPLDEFAQKYAQGVPNALPLQSLGPDGAGGGGGNGPGTGFRSSGLRASNPESHRRRSAGMWSTPPQTPSGGGNTGGGGGGGGDSSVRDGPSPPGPEFPVPTHPGDLDGGEGGGGGGTTTRGSGSHLGQGRPPSSIPASTTEGTQVPQRVIARARAMFDYNASPTDPAELTLVKGEILDIFDNSGKWWEAMKSNGTKGIAPSNYLQVL